VALTLPAPLLAIKV
jgi:hypothetical protein